MDIFNDKEEWFDSFIEFMRQAENTDGEKIRILNAKRVKEVTKYATRFTELLKEAAPDCKIKVEEDDTSLLLEISFDYFGITVIVGLKSLCDEIAKANSIDIFISNEDKILVTIAYEGIYDIYYPLG